MGKQYRATAEANSRNPQDWGRAMAWAMSDLSTQALADDSHERLFGEDLVLRVDPTEQGVGITLTWDAPEGLERTDTGAIPMGPGHARDDDEVADPEEGAAHPT
ncbi:hypothetical protein [Tersicoccus sp. Bi-70]|uniref:hypothetical protein n=1 Tax=Tersicoccus sp. Bi-70 TaxID=1897634 RepID=UPI0009762B54|nr:hypothetical protein [Tersicoccus sp. Bi-70]OMH34242.1 hypothetical protein BGP79_03715 [Tersicoccus sp. Bi-70]